MTTAYSDYVRACADPRIPLAERNLLFRAYVENRTLLADLVQKSRSEERDEVHERLQRVLDEELRALPKKKPASRREVEDFARRVAMRAGVELSNEFSRAAKEAYVAGLTEVGRRVGVGLRFNDRHERALRAAVEGDGVAESFENFTKATSNKFNDLIEAAYERGEVSPGRLVTQMIDVVGWQSRKRLERIARTETWKIWMEAQVQGYRDAEEQAGEQWHYRFGKIRDAKCCAICRAIMDAIPNEGLPLDELLEMMERIIREKAHPSWNPVRDGTVPLPHPHCRHDIWRTVHVPPVRASGRAAA